MGGVTRRLLLAVTAAMPPGRRGWGEAMIAELSYTKSRRDQAQLLLGAVRTAVLPPPGLGDCARSVRRASLVAVTAWIPLAVALYLANVVFRSPDNNAFGDLGLRLYLAIILMAAGAAARRAVPGRVPPIVAGIAAGLVLTALGLGTFAVIGGLGGHLNASVSATAPGVALLLAFAGAVLASLGAVIDQEIRAAWAHWRRVFPARSADRW
jgi:hypothetical protein